VLTGDEPFYVGTTPASAGGLFGDANELPEGYSENTGRGWAGWARRFNDIIVRAQKKAVLAEVTPQITREQIARPAGLRVRVAVRAPTQMAAILNAYGYERTRRASAGNVDFMHALMQQMRVPAAGARDAMRDVLAARPVCPMGGEFKLGDLKTARISTAWAKEHIGLENEVPPDFKSPFLQWFHGLELEFSIGPTSLTTHIELELATPSAPAPAKVESGK